MYNPWSVLYYFDSNCNPGPHWLDTSSNDIINELVEKLPFDIATNFRKAAGFVGAPNERWDN